MYMFATDLSLMSFIKSLHLTPSEKNSFHGYAKFNTRRQSKKNMDEVFIPGLPVG
jgi:hypothetical protein